MSKMRLAIADAIQKGACGGDRALAKNAAQKMLSEIVIQIGELQELS